MRRKGYSGKLPLSPQNIAIAKERLNGATLQEIASHHGVHEATVSRRLQQPELQEYIRRIQIETLEATAGPVRDNLIHLIGKYRENQCRSEKERIEKSHGARMTERMAEGMGIFPSRVQSYVVNQLLSVNVTAHTQELDQLAAFLRSQWSDGEENAIEVSPEEDNG